MMARLNILLLFPIPEGRNTFEGLWHDSCPLEFRKLALRSRSWAERSGRSSGHLRRSLKRVDAYPPTL
jgi:hypothetical protein